MTTEEKDLLLKDLCARLPYDVKVNNEIQGDFYVYGICENLVFVRNEVCHIDFSVENIKPYLFPLSSMTEEQWRELFKIAGYEEREEDCGRHTEIYYYDIVGHENTLHPNYNAIDWFNAHHFDYRGLIPMGLANDATGLNIY